MEKNLPRKVQVNDLQKSECYEIYFSERQRKRMLLNILNDIFGPQLRFRCFFVSRVCKPRLSLVPSTNFCSSNIICFSSRKQAVPWFVSNLPYTIDIFNSTTDYFSERQRKRMLLNILNDIFGPQLRFRCFFVSRVCKPRLSLVPSTNFCSSNIICFSSRKQAVPWFVSNLPYTIDIFNSTTDFVNAFKLPPGLPIYFLKFAGFFKMYYVLGRDNNDLGVRNNISHMIYTDLFIWLVQKAFIFA